MDATSQPCLATAREDVLDHALTGTVRGVSLAGEHDLHRPLRIMDQPRQALLVREQQGRALVRGEAPSEADGQHVRIEGLGQSRQGRRWLAVTGELVEQPAPREVGQLQLLALMGLPQTLVLDALETLPEAVVGQVGVEGVQLHAQSGIEVADRPAQPAGRMHAVGDAQDGLVDHGRPGRVGRLGMEPADRVGAAGEAQGEGRHIELPGVVIHAATQLQDAFQIQVDARGHGRRRAPHQVRVEALVAGCDRRVDGEHRPAADTGEGLLEREAVGHELPRLLHQHEG